MIGGFAQIIYTSGSTGQPKGVRHQSGQIAWSAAALGSATGATATDSYLSVLPLPLLLETICSIFIPPLLGAYVPFGMLLGGYGQPPRRTSLRHGWPAVKRAFCVGRQRRNRRRWTFDNGRVPRARPRTRALADR